jgi:RNA polymerase sigma-70 factor, ECF subfamily
VQRESYIGPWLPEPLLASDNQPDSSSDDAFGDDETLSVAFLVLLEKLTPVARAVFLLREVFDYEYVEIAGMLECEESACRQIFSRARKDLANDQKRFQPSPEAHHRILLSFMDAVTQGNLQRLTDLLSEDVVMWADGGGKVRGAATRPVHGPGPVATFLISSRRFVPEGGVTFDFAMVNTSQGIILRQAGKPFAVLTFETENDQIRAMRLVANPDKLGHVR